MYIDIHSHIDFSENQGKIIKNARKAGVGIIINSGTSPEANRKTLELASKFKEIKPSLGAYPINALKLSGKEFSQELEFIKSAKGKIIAIGEVGMDFKEDSLYHEKQEENFKKLVLLAKEIGKPLIIHSRKAEKECIEILESLNAKRVVMHCFFGKLSLAARIVQNNWFLSIPASVKQNEQMQALVSQTPLQNLLCETDSPFLHPDKKQNNEPCFVVEAYKKIAEIKSLSLKEVEKQIEKNYNSLFS